MCIVNDVCSLLGRYLRGGGVYMGWGRVYGGGRGDMIDVRGLFIIGFYL